MTLGEVAGKAPATVEIVGTSGRSIGCLSKIVTGISGAN